MITGIFVLLILILVAQLVIIYLLWSLIALVSTWSGFQVKWPWSKKQNLNDFGRWLSS